MTHYLETHGNWEYQIPRDPELLLYDFYFLFRYVSDVNTSDEEFNYALQQGARECIDYLGKWMIYALFYAVKGELDHLNNKSNFRTGEKDFTYTDDETEEEEEDTLEDEEEYGVEVLPPKEKIAKWKKFDNPYDQKLYSKLIMLNQASWKTLPDLFVSEVISEMIPNVADQALYYVHLFGDYSWHSQFGGKAWMQLSQALYNLLTANTPEQKAIWIDHAYDLEHNNNTFIDKIVYTKSKYKYTKKEPHNSEYYGEYPTLQWLKRGLDWKKDNADLEEFYYKVSPSLKPIVAYVLKNIHGRSIEGFEKAYNDKRAEYNKLKVYFDAHKNFELEKKEEETEPNTLVLLL